MPSPFDPLMPQSWIDPLQQKLEKRSLDQTPDDARLKGFGAGALQGLRDMTTPANIAGTMMGGMGGAASKLFSKAAPALQRAAGPTMQLIDDIIPFNGVRQAAPKMDEVAELMNSMRSNLKGVPSSGNPRVPMPPEMAPMTAPMAPSGPQVVQGLKRAIDPRRDNAFRRYIDRTVR